MITYLCRHCRRPLEVDADLAGKIAACPHCRQVSPVPLRSTAADVPMARPAGGAPMDPMPLAEDDRAAAQRLPPDSGQEQHVYTVRPAMLRAKPLHALGLILLAAAGIAAIGWGFHRSVDWLKAFGLVALAIAVIWGAYWKVVTNSTALIITNKRSTLRVGLLRRESKEILHDKVQDLQIAQSFPQRMLGIGTLGISNAGETDVEILVHDVPNPRRIREIIDAYREVG